MSTVEINNREIAELFGAGVAIRRAARNMDFAKMTLEDIKIEALAFIGGERTSQAPGSTLGNIIDSSKPAGKLDRLAAMERRVNDIVSSAAARVTLPTAT